jgi:hypothetical protein
LTDWPLAELGPLRRAKVLSAALRGAVWVEGVLDAPYRATWSWVADLEHSIPSFDSTVSKVTIQERHALAGDSDIEHVRLRATSYGVPLPFEVRIEDGFCLMRARARLYLVVMAAEPEDGGLRTRFLHMEGVPLPGTRLLEPLLRREVRSDLANLARLAAGGF